MRHRLTLEGSFHRRLAAVLLILASLFNTRLSSGAPPPRAMAKVDGRVWDDTAKERKGNFLIFLSEQADTRPVAKGKQERKARGRAVVSALRATADRTQPAVRALLNSHRASYSSFWIANAIAVEGSRQLVEALSLRPDVLAIESDRAFLVSAQEADAQPAAPANPSSTAEPNLVTIKAPDLWALGVRGQGIVYANADSGVNWTHPALLPQYRGWDGTNADHNYNWWDAIHSAINPNGSHPCGFSSPVPCDDTLHGSHTMGIGIGDDGSGNRIGVAPGAKWIACRNMDNNYGRPSTYMECLQFFLAPTDLAGLNPDPDRGADCVGNSYTCPFSEQCVPDSLRLAVENMRSAGVFMAVAAGNYGPGCGTVNEPPALEASATTVGATTSTDGIANFSSRGPVTVDGSNRPKPDLVAPGVNVRSASAGNSYATRSGTSMSTPHVAGAVALLWSAFPQFRGDIDSTETALKRGALPLTTSQGCGGDSLTQVPNNVFGYGRLDVLAAYTVLSNQPPQSAEVLRITRAGNLAILSWPTNATSYVLESAPTFPASSGAWTAVTNSPVTIGSNLVVTIDASGLGRSFRLRWRLE